MDLQGTERPRPGEHRWTRGLSQDEYGRHYRQCIACGKINFYGRKWGSKKYPAFAPVDPLLCPMVKLAENKEEGFSESRWRPELCLDGSSSHASSSASARRIEPTAPDAVKYPRMQAMLHQKEHRWSTGFLQDEGGHYRYCLDCHSKQYYGKRFGSKKHPGFSPADPEMCLSERDMSRSMNIRVNAAHAFYDSRNESKQKQVAQHEWSLELHQDNSGCHYRQCALCGCKQYYGKKHGSIKHPAFSPAEPEFCPLRRTGKQ